MVTDNEKNISKIEQMRMDYINAQEELEKIKKLLYKLAGESIPHIVNNMKELGITELNLSDMDSLKYFSNIDCYYCTGWDEGEYEPRRLFVYDDRLYLMGLESNDYTDGETAQSALNLSSSNCTSDSKLYYLMGDLIPHLLDKDDDIYSFTDFDEDYERADIDVIKDEFQNDYFSENDRL